MENLKSATDILTENEFKIGKDVIPVSFDEKFTAFDGREQKILSLNMFITEVDKPKIEFNQGTFLIHDPSTRQDLLTRNRDVVKLFVDRGYEMAKLEKLPGFIGYNDFKFVDSEKQEMWNAHVESMFPANIGTHDQEFTSQEGSQGGLPNTDPHIGHEATPSSTLKNTVGGLTQSTSEQSKPPFKIDPKKWPMNDRFSK